MEYSPRNESHTSGKMAGICVPSGGLGRCAALSCCGDPSTLALPGGEWLHISGDCIANKPRRFRENDGGLLIVQQTSVPPLQELATLRLDCMANRRGNTAPHCADLLESKANKPSPRQAVKREL